MNYIDLFRGEISELMTMRGSTTMHITGIRHGDFRETAESFIDDAARKRLSASLFPEKANPLDHKAVVCRRGKLLVGHVATYDLEKYYILAAKEDADHLSGHFARGIQEDHLLEMHINSTLTYDDILDYRTQTLADKSKEYGGWHHEAIDQYLVHSHQQDEAIACISQMLDFTSQLYVGFGSSTLSELEPLLKDYNECSQYDISLEGQQRRWDIMLALDCLYDHHRQGLAMDEETEAILNDVVSQIGGEIVRSVTYIDYIERLTALITEHLPSSETALHHLKALPSEAVEQIRQQTMSFPHHLYHLFKNDLKCFVRTLFYARIPRRYLDPFLSGIALVEAFDKKAMRDWQSPDEKTIKLRNLGRLLEEWYEDYCERIVHYPIIRQLNALQVMRKQVLEQVRWAEGSPRFGDNPDDIDYLFFVGKERNFVPRLKDFGMNFGVNAQGKMKNMAWEDYIPEKYGHNVTLVEFGYIYFISALNYEIDRLKEQKTYDEPFEEPKAEIKTPATKYQESENAPEKSPSPSFGLSPEKQKQWSDIPSQLIQKEELNFFQPKRHLQDLLKQPWFAEVRTNERYDDTWTDSLVAALMTSEHGEGIARDWALTGHNSRKNQIKGRVVGLLKDNNVIKGASRNSYSELAAIVGIIVNEQNGKDPYGAFAKYMSQGKKQPYADWVKDYVKQYDSLQ